MESGMNHALSKHENYQEEKAKWGDEFEFISETCMTSEEKETYNFIRAFWKWILKKLGRNIDSLNCLNQEHQMMYYGPLFLQFRQMKV